MERSKELEDLTQELFEMFVTGDSSVVDRAVSTDDTSVVIGTDPREWWRGEEIARAFKAQADELSQAGVKFNMQDLAAFSDGDLGVVSARPAFTTPGGDVELRVTGAFKKQGGDWKLVQWHASIGISNEESVGQELTT